MWICAYRCLCPRIPWGLLLTSPSAVQAAEGNEANAPDCAQSGLEPQPVTVQMTQSDERVEATLHSSPSALPALGCMTPLQFQIPADSRPPIAVWRDVEDRAVKADGTGPAHPIPCRSGSGSGPTAPCNTRCGRPGDARGPGSGGGLGHDRRGQRPGRAGYLRAALGSELSPWGLGAMFDDRGRVTELDWHADHPMRRMSIAWTSAQPTQGSGLIRRGCGRPGNCPRNWANCVTVRLALGGPLLTGTIRRNWAG